MALWSFAVAQPLYDVLGRYAELFVARRTPPSQIWLLVLLVSLALPALLAVPVAAARLAGRRAAALASRLLVGALAAAIALPVLERLALPGAPGIAGALLAGAAAAFAYRRWSAVRWFLTALSPAALVFPAVFLFLTPVRSVIFPEREGGGGGVEWRRTPVVILVFDLFPVTALMDAAGGVDGERYPGFARLAADSVWLRQAKTVAATTSDAVPALLTGRTAVRGTLPIVAEYPDSLFTLVGPGIRTWIFESMTWLCPESLCGHTEEQMAAPRLSGLLRDAAIVYLHVLLPLELAAGLPAVDQQWFGFDKTATNPRALEEPAAELSERQRDQRLRMIRDLRARVAHEDREAKLERFLEGLPGSGPSLSYLHLSMPHGPFVYLPSGRRYVDSADPHRRNLEMIQGQVRRRGYPRWLDDEALVDLDYRRLLLHVGFTDRSMGRILDRLDELGIYDSALLAVVADHGQSYRPGGLFRDLEDGGTLHVPFFVKVPFARHGAIDDRPADLRDLLPTIARVLEIEVPWEMEGRALLGGERLDRLRNGPASEADANRLPRRDWPSPLLERDLRLKLARVGYGDPETVYATGPAPELLGLSIEALARGAGGATLAPRRGDVVVHLDQSAALAAVDPASGFLPAYLLGTLELPAGVEPPVELALAIDGVIRATARTYRRGDYVCFAALVPESVLTPGPHRWSAYLLERAGGTIRLAEARPATSP